MVSKLCALIEHRLDVPKPNLGPQKWSICVWWTTGVTMIDLPHAPSMSMYYRLSITKRLIRRAPISCSPMSFPKCCRARLVHVMLFRMTRPFRPLVRGTQSTGKSPWTSRRCELTVLCTLKIPKVAKRVKCRVLLCEWRGESERIWTAGCSRIRERTKNFIVLSNIEVRTRKYIIWK